MNKIGAIRQNKCDLDNVLPDGIFCPPRLCLYALEVSDCLSAFKYWTLNVENGTFGRSVPFFL